MNGLSLGVEAGTAVSIALALVMAPPNNARFDRP
jgi:hypothetical protein